MTEYKIGDRVRCISDSDLFLISFDDFYGGRAGGHADPFAYNMWWLRGYELEREEAEEEGED